MSNPLRSVNRIANSAIDSTFKSLLLKGHWKEVGYEKFDSGERYNLIAYSTKRSQVAKVFHDKIVEKGFENGIFQNARNKAFQDAIDKISNEITVDEVEMSARFKTMWD